MNHNSADDELLHEAQELQEARQVKAEVGTKQPWKHFRFVLEEH
jgi:hypothetical protein